MRAFFFLCLFLNTSPLRSWAQQDSLSLTLPQAEAQFRQNNLTLLANRLGIDENRAYEIQSRLYVNPTIYVEQMPYNPQTREVMPLRQRNSEQLIQVQQLILLAGKRNKQLALTTTNTKLAADRFEDLTRTLTFQLRSAFYDLYYTQQALRVYEAEQTTLQRTVDLYQQQYDKGNVPLKDLTRLKAYLFNLSTERQQRLSQLADDQTTLSVLLNTNPSIPIRPVVPTNTPVSQPNPQQLTLDSLLSKAENNRPDLRGLRDQTTLERQNLSLQKALAKPDLGLQGTFDRNAGYVQNYVGVGVNIMLPVLNRNQGNIKAAQIRIQSSTQNLNAYQVQVDAEVQNALTKAQQADGLYRTFDNRFNEDFGRLIRGVTENYRKQNIDVVEFLDFFDAYKNTQLQYNQLQNDRRQRFEELNLAVGQPVL